VGSRREGHGRSLTWLYSCSPFPFSFFFTLMLRRAHPEICEAEVGELSAQGCGWFPLFSWPTFFQELQTCKRELSR